MLFSYFLLRSLLPFSNAKFLLISCLFTFYRILAIPIAIVATILSGVCVYYGNLAWLDSSTVYGIIGRYSIDSIEVEDLGGLGGLYSPHPTGNLIRNTKNSMYWYKNALKHINSCIKCHFYTLQI